MLNPSNRHGAGEDKLMAGEFEKRNRWCGLAPILITVGAFVALLVVVAILRP